MILYNHLRNKGTVTGDASIVIIYLTSHIYCTILLSHENNKLNISLYKDDRLFSRKILPLSDYLVTTVSDYKHPFTVYCRYRSILKDYEITLTYYNED